MVCLNDVLEDVLHKYCTTKEERAIMCRAWTMIGAERLAQEVGPEEAKTMLMTMDNHLEDATPETIHRLLFGRRQ